MVSYSRCCKCQMISFTPDALLQMKLKRAFGVPGDQDEGVQEHLYIDC